MNLNTKGSAGKYQIANEKTQLELDKAHQEINQNISSENIILTFFNIKNKQI